MLLAVIMTIAALMQIGSILYSIVNRNAKDPNIKPGANHPIARRIWMTAMLFIPFPLIFLSISNLIQEAHSKMPLTRQAVFFMCGDTGSICLAVTVFFVLAGMFAIVELMYVLENFNQMHKGTLDVLVDMNDQIWKKPSRKRKTKVG